MSREQRSVYILYQRQRNGNWADGGYLVYILSVGRQGSEVKRKSYAAVSVQDHFQSLARFAADRGRG